MRKTKGGVWPKPRIFDYIIANRIDLAKKDFDKGMRAQFMRILILLNIDSSMKCGVLTDIEEEEK